MFEYHATYKAESVALTCGSVSATYGELNVLSNRFAHYLIDRGIGPGSLVGICLDRSIELLVTILGTLKAGAAYVPFDTTYPLERLRLMASQLTALKMVVVSPATGHLVSGIEQETIDVTAAAPVLRGYPQINPRLELGGDDLCYAVFTSGSTGTPKATAVRHRGWYNLLEHLRRRYSLDRRSDNLMVSSFGFDISQRSLLMPLFSGATQHLLPSRNFDAMMASRLIRERAVRTLHCAPSTLYLLVERDRTGRPDDLASIEHVFVGGEPLSAKRVAGWASATGRNPLVNVYGVAECTDVSTDYVLRDYDRYVTAGVPIGRPVANNDVHLLDDELRPVSPGETGEICVAGVGLGVGYLNAPELTAEKFVKVATADGYLDVYRTGDLGYVAADGNVMCVGRVDLQVKIRGMRIDLGDVETAICGNPRVTDAAVAAVGDAAGNDKELVAFVIAVDDELDAQALRAELRTALPSHMVPQRIKAVAGFPLSPNGKVDRKSLAQLAVG